MLFLVFVIAFFHESFARDLPSYFPRCYIDDPNLNECILNATRTLKPYVRDGIEEIKLPSLNPLKFPRYSASQDSDLIKLNTTILNSVIRGLDNYEFTDISFDPKTLTLDVKLAFQKLYVSCDFWSNATFLYFPFRGNGSIEAEFGSANSSITVEGKLNNRNGVNYYNPTSSKVLIKINGFSVHATGLFGDNNELAQVTNDLVNLNSQAIVDAGIPIYERIAEKIVMNAVKTLTRLVPYEKIFPKSSS